MLLMDYLYSFSRHVVSPSDVHTSGNSRCCHHNENLVTRRHPCPFFADGWWRMAVGGHFCRVAEDLRHPTLILTHHHRPPSPQKSDTCANPVPIPPYTGWTPTDLYSPMYHPGIWRTAGHGRCKIGMWLDSGTRTPVEPPSLLRLVLC